MNRTALRTGDALTWLALLGGLLSGVAALLAGPAYRGSLLSLGSAFLVLRWATIAAMAGAGVAVLAWGLLTLGGARRGRTLAAAALVVNAIVAGPPLYLYAQAQSLPNIHDISTDTLDPPVFVAVLPLRQGARNPVTYPPETAAQQRLGYPDIAPLVLGVPPARAFERAERAARAMGWQIAAVAPDELRIEATDTTLFFGFNDDVVIRIRPQGQGSVVDIRSLSRIGGSDIGTNARRVRRFLETLAAN